jgi:hypothetical protein
MVRLAHVALAALGGENVLFAQNAARLHLSLSLLRIASLSFMAAALLMPAACLWLAAQGRWLEPRNWRKCTFFDVNFRPLHMTPRSWNNASVVLWCIFAAPESWRAGTIAS